MLNLGYKNWLLPYVEGTLDPRHAAMLEARLKVDPSLAAEVESLRRVTSHLRASAVADKAASTERTVFLAARPSVWPRVEAAIDVRRGGAVYTPRFALAGGLAVIAVAGLYWTGVGHKSPAQNQVAVNPVASPSMTPVAAAPDVPSKPAVSVPTLNVEPRLAKSGGPYLAENRDGNFPKARRPISPPRSRDFVMASNDSMPAEPRSMDPAGGSPSPSTPPVLVIDKPLTEGTGGGTTLNTPMTTVDQPSPPSTSAPVLVSRVNYSVDENEIAPTPRVGNGTFEDTTLDSLDSDGLSSPFAASPAYSGGVAGSKALVLGLMTPPSSTLDFSANADVSLKALRLQASQATNALTVESKPGQLDDALTVDSKPDQMHDALNTWRDAVEVDLNATVDQNSTTSAQADETLGMLNGDGYLPDFDAMMRDECNARPDEVASWRILGHIDTIQGNTADAVKDWTEVTSLNAATAEDWYQLGLVQQAAQDTVDAIASFQKVVDQDEPSRAADAAARIASLKK